MEPFMRLTPTQLEILNALADGKPVTVYATDTAQLPEVAIGGTPRSVFRSLRSLRDRGLVTYMATEVSAPTTSPGQVLGHYLLP